MAGVRTSDQCYGRFSYNRTNAMAGFRTIGPMLWQVLVHQTNAMAGFRTVSDVCHSMVLGKSISTSN